LTEVVDREVGERLLPDMHALIGHACRLDDPSVQLEENAAISASAWEKQQ
jgi:hypothetical protein